MIGGAKEGRDDIFGYNIDEDQLQSNQSTLCPYKLGSKSTLCPYKKNPTKTRQRPLNEGRDHNIWL